jgi:ABC-type branched-subunit amino acid transport system substrate-binding protein
MRRRDLLGGLGIGVLGACFRPAALVAQDTSRSAGSSDSLRLGLIANLSGLAASVGSLQTNMIALVEEQVNVQGGVKGRPLHILGPFTVSAAPADRRSLPGGTLVEFPPGAFHTVDVGGRLVARHADTPRDYRRYARALVYSDPATNDKAPVVRAFHELADQQVVAVLGPLLTSTAVALVAASRERQVPLVTFATSSRVFASDASWVFSTGQPPGNHVGRLVGFLSKKSLRRVAFVTDPLGSEVRDLLRKHAAERGLSVVADVQAPLGSDLQSELHALASSGADAVVSGLGSPVSRQTLLKHRASLGRATVCVVDGAGVDVGTGDVEGVVAVIDKYLLGHAIEPGGEHGQRIVDFKRKYAAVAPLTPGASPAAAASAYDGLHLVLEAVDAVGGERRAVRSYLEARSGFLGASGTFRFGPDRRAGAGDDHLDMAIARQGHWVLLE